MRLVAALVALLAIGVLTISSSEAAHLDCHTGNALGFVALKSDPPHLVGTLPARFTANPDFFDTRYNCRGRGVQARRVDLGTYEVRFVGAKVPDGKTVGRWE